jgi:predicted alpha/beta superfamily hydrolase
MGAGSLEHTDYGWTEGQENDNGVSEERLAESQRASQAQHDGTVASTLTGNIRLHRALPSRFLAHARDVIVYLPPDYESSPNAYYPVLYLQDGQNLFDAATAFIPGHDWKADETAEELILSGQVRPFIMVGIYHAGESRLEEYTPDKDSTHPDGGKARLYGRFLTEELKPFIDSVYRTLPGPRHNAIGGSSLGALVSIFTALNFSDVFGHVVALSPSVWWNRNAMVRRVAGLESKRSVRIWLDMGTEEGPGALRSVRAMREALVAKGWVEGIDLRYLEIEGANHSEDAWAARIGEVLRWLFPPEQ